MLDQFLAGAAVNICNIALHACIMTAVVQVARATGVRMATRPSLHLIGVMSATVAVLVAAHTVEVLVWALAYRLIGVAPPGADLVYFAFVNYTTLGYGDITPAANWNLLGPMAAMNGVLLFGWSTAVIFEVLRRAMALEPS